MEGIGARRSLPLAIGAAAVFVIGLLVGRFGAEVHTKDDAVPVPTTDIGEVLARLDTLAMMIRANSSPAGKRYEESTATSPETVDTADKKIQAVIASVAEMTTILKEAIASGRNAYFLTENLQPTDPEVIRSIGLRVSQDSSAALKDYYLWPIWKVIEKLGKPNTVSSTSSTMTWEYDTNTEFSLCVDFQSGLVTGISYRQP